MPMTLEQLSDQLDRYGADLERWPDPDPARELIAADPAARALLDQARELEAALTRALEAPPAAVRQIRGAVNAALEKPNRWMPATWFALGWLRPVLAATLPLGLGFALGLSSGAPDLQMLSSLDLLSLEQGATLDEFLETNLTLATEDPDHDS